ncbi:MAG: DNA polymerase III subunit delta [Deltaproteobacteria bacterium]|jgi:DNA polymerase-3 subunit delta|nr:DNA polymerase III subunit delta [Deltaproteobacteria bacterium]
MELTEFIKEIDSPNRQPFYLLLGDNPEAQAQAISAAKKVVDESFFDFNFQSFKSDEDNWGDILEEVGTAPFFIPPRVVVVRRDKFSDPELDKLARYLENPNADNVLLLLATQEQAEKPRFFKNYLERRLWVDCLAPDKNELPFWLIKKAQDRGVTLTNEGAQAMIERLGDNLNQLLGELDKMSLYPGPETTITAKEVAELCSLGPTAIIYELGEPIANQNPALALEKILDLEEESSPYRLAVAIGNHFLRLYRFKVSLESANPESLTGATPLGFKPLYFQKLKGQVGKWSFNQLAEALKAIFRAQRAMFTVSTPQSLILQELTLNLSTFLKPTRS